MSQYFIRWVFRSLLYVVVFRDFVYRCSVDRCFVLVVKNLGTDTVDTGTWLIGKVFWSAVEQLFYYKKIKYFFSFIIVHSKDCKTVSWKKYQKFKTRIPACWQIFVHKVKTRDVERTLLALGTKLIGSTPGCSRSNFPKWVGGGGGQKYTRFFFVLKY